MLTCISSQHYLLQNRQARGALAPVHANLGEGDSIAADETLAENILSPQFFKVQTRILFVGHEEDFQRLREHRHAGLTNYLETCLSSQPLLQNAGSSLMVSGSNGGGKNGGTPFSIFCIVSANGAMASS